MSKTNVKCIEYLEEVVIGAGFLLKKLYATYGHELGAGMDAQVRHCIRDCDDVGRVYAKRKEAQ